MKSRRLRLATLDRLIGTKPDAATLAWAWMTGASTFRLAIGFIASVLIARALGPSTLGVYATLAAIAATVGALAEFGLTESAVRRIAMKWTEPGRPVDTTGATYVWLRIAMTTSVVVVLVALLPFGAAKVFVPVGPAIAAFALVGVIATALSGAVSGLLQATGRFGRLSLVMVVNSALTAALAVLLRVTGTLNLTTALIVLGIGTSLTCFALGRAMLDRGIRLAPPPWSTFRREAGQLLHFGRWLWLANSLAMLAAQLDLLLAGRWLSSATVGAYALAVTLASKAGVANQSLHAALLPFASSLRSEAAVRTYLRRGLSRSLLIGLALIVATPLIRMLIPTIFGADFGPSVDLFSALVGVAVVDLIATPILMLAYTADMPKLIATADGLRVVVLVTVAAALLPTVGVYGLIVAKLLASLVGLAATVVALKRRFGSADLSQSSLTLAEDEPV